MELNVFSGKNALLDLHNPDKNPPLPLVELPQHPFVDDGVKIYAKLLNMLPAANVKVLTARNMMDRAEEATEFNPACDTVVECSSGNTVISLAILNAIRDGKPVEAYISNKTSEQKIQLLRFFGLKLKLFGGPAQVEPSDPNGGIYAAIEAGKQEGVWNPSQYANPSNSEAHIRWTGPQLMRQLPNISVFAASIGTSGTMTGTGTYLRRYNPKIVNLGVFTAAGDRVPGPRPVDLIQSIDLPWRKVITDEEHVTSTDSYLESLQMCRKGLLCGPSSGLALRGLFQYLEKMRSSGKLDTIRSKDGNVNCVFICCDQPFQYVGEYFGKVDESLFAPIECEELLQVDRYRYGIDWKISHKAAMRILGSVPLSNDDCFLCSRSPKSHMSNKSGVVVLDLRDRRDFARDKFCFSVNLDMNSSGQPNCFHYPELLVCQWKLLDVELARSNPKFAALYHYRTVLVICYDGNLSSVACSVLRHNGANAFYIDGGVNGWREAGCSQQVV